MDTHREDGERRGDRFVIERRLGDGGSGTVFAAYDRQRQAHVALKMLRHASPEKLLRFKNEFRSLAEVTHPNLVTLYELVFTGDHWCLAMELVDGTDFLSWVRGRPGPGAPGPATATTMIAPPGQTPSGTQRSTRVGETPPSGIGPGGGDPARWPPPFPLPLAGAGLDEPRLRAALGQLVAGVMAIHRAGRLHRDLKPSNVRITPGGRVVVLDFDLVERLAPRRPGAEPTGLMGTPAYMAPEQWLGLGATPASDWYALGTMLFEALTGQLPFDGYEGRSFKDKGVRDAPSPDELAPEAPPDLVALCRRLLRRDPTERPAAEELSQVLGGGGQQQEVLIASSRADARDGRDVALVARERPLEELRQAYAACGAAGHPVVVRVRGVSGVGKSALVQHFLAATGEASPVPPLVLAGRCYERESLPHKAFDSLIDALAAHLMALPPERLTALLPPGIGALARLFPVLRRIAAVDRELDRGAAEDPRELRRRALAALKALLGSLAAAGPVIVHIDDLQWGDPEAADILATVLQGPEPPPVLWILGNRSENEASSELLRALPARLAGLSPPVDARVISVAPLSPEESEALALRLLRRDDPEARRLAREIAREAAGSPLFVGELVRLGSSPLGQVSLEAVLRARVQMLPGPAQELLRRVSVAGRPLRQGLLIEAAGVGAAAEQALRALQNGNFVRTTGPERDDLIEPFHDRVQETIVAGLEPDALRRCHQDLARVIEADFGGPGGVAGARTADIEALAIHTRAVGRDGDAGRWSLLAARRARDLYASRDAVRHYQGALALLEGRIPTDEHLALREEAAETCRQAGLYDDAAAHLTACLEATAAAALPDESRARLLLARGRVLQERGHTSGSLRDLEEALRLSGRKVPDSTAGLVVGIAGAAAAYFLGGSRNTGGAVAAPAPARPRSAAIERQVDVLFTLMRIYFFADRAKVVWAGLTAMNLARRSQSPAALALAHGYFGILLSGVGRLEQAARSCDQAVALARQSGSRLAEGLALERRGTCAVFENRLDEAITWLDESIAALRATGEVWELKTSLMLQAAAHFLSGRLDPAIDRWAEIHDLSLDLGGTLHLGWALAWRPYARYLRGQIDAAAAQDDLRRAAGLSRDAGDVANRGVALCHLAAVTASAGRPDEAAAAAEEAFTAIWAYRVGIPFVQAKLLDAAEAALTALETGGATSGGTADRLLGMVDRAAGRLGRLARAYPHLAPLALRLRARRLALRSGSGSGSGSAARMAEAAVTAAEGGRSRNRLWLAAAHADAARLVTERQAEHAAAAAAMLAELGVVPGRLGARPPPGN